MDSCFSPSNEGLHSSEPACQPKPASVLSSQARRQDQGREGGKAARAECFLGTTAPRVESLEIGAIDLSRSVDRGGRRGREDPNCTNHDGHSPDRLQAPLAPPSGRRSTVYSTVYARPECGCRANQTRRARVFSLVSGRGASCPGNQWLGRPSQHQEEALPKDRLSRLAHRPPRPPPFHPRVRPQCSTSGLATPALDVRHRICLS